MKKALGINDFLDKEFKTYPFAGPWLASLGTPEQNFRVLISGPKKNGKTDLTVKLCKYVSQWGKVYYNSFEEGISKTLQDAFKRNNMKEVAGQVMLLHKYTFEQLMKKLAAKGSPRFVVIDSRDYMKLTSTQYATLVDTFPRKSFFIICWCERNGEPKGNHAQEISYMVDIIIQVKNFVAYPVSRFGGNEPFYIKDKGEVTTQKTLF